MPGADPGPRAHNDEPPPPREAASQPQPAPQSVQCRPAQSCIASQAPTHQDAAEDPGSARDPTPPSPDEARHVVGLFQCFRCSLPYRNAVTVPCGRNMCRQCLPETHARTSITYPALPNRLQAFQCPFEDCGREHALDDCGIDVVLNKAAQVMREEIERSEAEAAELGISTRLAATDPWDAAGIPSLRPDDNEARLITGAKVVATWALAADGGLKYGAEVTFFQSTAAPSPEGPRASDAGVLSRLQQRMRGEMDCQVCYALFYDPVTTGCGHTFCRPCLHRILDHSQYCPVCRHRLAMSPLLKRESCPSNQGIVDIMQTFWKTEMAARTESVAAERAASLQDLGTPLFICALAFPSMPTFLHVFEPRYRLMLRRAMEGDKTFGMVLPRRPHHSSDAHFYELGTLLRIVNTQFYPDGRSLIETVGLSRFRILRHGQVDGYTVAKTERIDDVSLEEEEAMEAAEVGFDTGRQQSDADDNDGDGDGDRDGARPSGSASPRPPQRANEWMPQTAADLDTMSTRSLMKFATGFVRRMAEQNVPWLTGRILDMYGECPSDPAMFPWWLASTLPLKDFEKYRLLGASSVRERLKICGVWIMDMDSRVRW